MRRCAGSGRAPQRKHHTMTSACKAARWFATIFCLVSLVQFASGSTQSIGYGGTAGTESLGASVLGSGASGIGSGEELDPLKDAVTIPTCTADDEFLSSDGLQLVCRRIPPCTCFVGGPISGPTSVPTTEDPRTDTSVPLPPTGCPVFQPPLRGAFVCYLNSTINLMFCNIYCDHNFEFLNTPHNPYFCGPSTNFTWHDTTRRILNTPLECTGHRISPAIIHRDSDYLPSPCYGLTDHTILAIMNEFREMLRRLGYATVAENVFMQCPSFDGIVYSYNDVMLRATHRRRKRYAKINAKDFIH